MAVVGDALYGQGEPILLSAIKKKYRASEEPEQPLMGRLGLHALRLTIAHPATGEAHTFVAPYPKDFTATLNQLRKHMAWQQQPIPLS
jgi:23S rRNA-/tRNA-specific pseudouridylate synthase